MTETASTADTTAPAKGRVPEKYRPIQERVAAIKASEGLSWTTIANEAGVAAGTLSPWVTGTYGAPGHEVAEALTRWLDARESRAATRAVLGEAPGFVATPTAQAITAVLQFAQVMPDFCPIVGAPGIGKTTTIEEYRRRNPHVYVTTAVRSQGRPVQIMGQLCDELGVGEKSTSLLFGAVRQHLAGKTALIVIDEAQHLTFEALEQMRQLHDLARCGVALAGNVSLVATLRGGSAPKKRIGEFAQITSRVGATIVQAELLRGDVGAVLDAWGIADRDMRQLLSAIAGKAGALRLMTKTIRLATLMGAGQGRGLDIELIRAAYARLPADSIAA